MSLTILAAAFVVIGGGVAYLLGLWDRPEFVYKQHLLAATQQKVEEEKTQQTLASKNTSDTDINKNDDKIDDDNDQDDAKEVYILLVKGQKPPHSKYQCEMLHGAKKSLDRVMGSEKDADALLQKGAQVMGGEEKCGVAVVAMYLDNNNNSNASTSHESATKAEDDDDDDEEDEDEDDNNNSPTTDEATTPKDNECPRWGCGFVVGCNDLKEAQEIAKGVQKDSDQTIVALPVGGPDQPVLQARIPWRHYLSPMVSQQNKDKTSVCVCVEQPTHDKTIFCTCVCVQIASRLHWQRCYDLYDAPDSPYHSDGGRREGDQKKNSREGNDNDDDLVVVDGSVAMETFLVCQKQKFMWIDYTLLMGNTQPIWDAMDPQ